MIYLTIFWVIYILFIALYLSAKLFKFEEIRITLDKNGMLLFIGLMSFLFVAIASKDPVTIAGITIPMELQWLASLFASGFGVWQFYLRPLKDKVYSMDREVGEIKTSLSKIEKSVDILLSKALKK